MLAVRFAESAPEDGALPAQRHHNLDDVVVRKPFILPALDAGLRAVPLTVAELLEREADHLSVERRREHACARDRRVFDSHHVSGTGLKKVAGTGLDRSLCWLREWSAAASAASGMRRLESLRHKFEGRGRVKVGADDVWEDRCSDAGVVPQVWDSFRREDTVYLGEELSEETCGH